MLSVTVQSIIQETSDTITLVLDTGSALFHYQAGQYITLLLAIDNEPYYRSYSLCTAPYVDQMPAITIKKVSGGKVSNYLHEHIREGDILEVIPPQGHMTLSAKRNQVKHLFLIAGGSGITPLYSILKSALDQEAHTTIHLVNANRHENAIIYRRQLKAWQSQYPNRLQVSHILSQPSELWQGIAGRLTPTRLAQWIADHELSTTDYYICAPQGLTQMSVDTLLAHGVAPISIHRESFGTSQQHKSVDSVEAEVTLAVGSYEEIYTVSAGETVLEAALNEGIYTLPYSCMSGTCNSCRAKCTKGKVHMETDEGLSEQEKKEGYILTCVARPLTKEVELEID
ncbi:MAG: ferredoxin--NADP reductase [Bacteroidota bacterium]